MKNLLLGIAVFVPKALGRRSRSIYFQNGAIGTTSQLPWDGLGRLNKA